MSEIELPLERLEAEICELAGHLAAGTCRFLRLVGDYDRREGWAQWGTRSCAHWLSWRCGIGLAAAREQVRVARALPGLPRLAEAFAAGRLSYSKVRAITRAATPETEADLVDIAGHTTASQLERLCSGMRQAMSADAAAARRARRRVRYYRDEDGSLVLRARLDPEEGALVLAALQAGADALTHGSVDVSAETSSADALVEVASGFLASPKAAARGDRYQVVIDATAGFQSPGLMDGGPLLHPDTVRRIACDSTIAPADHGTATGTGRARRLPSTATRRALRSRDQGRCRYPSCTNRRTDAHHIVFWSHGGPTTLSNLVSLCRPHHTLIHEGGHRITTGAGGELGFHGPDGRTVEPVPAQGATHARVEELHDAAVTPATVVPDWDGSRLDLGYAVSVLCDR